MREITKYIAEDGTEFNSMDACLCYENGIMDAIKTISEFCSKNKHCEDCAFHMDFKGTIKQVRCSLKATIPKGWPSLVDKVFNKKDK